MEVLNKLKPNFWRVIGAIGGTQCGRKGNPQLGKQ
jgi:hypothetical protein